MTDRPIIFSAPMIAALIRGRKTMTRRLAWAGKNSPSFWQRSVAGDRLYVRESLQRFNGSKGTPSAQYAADLSPVAAPPDHAKLIDGRALWNWSNPSIPSIYMPRWASRLTLIVTASKIERLQKISNEDAVAEGCGVNFDHPRPELTRDTFPAQRFRDLWISLHGADSWDDNPQVVALTFTVHQQNIDAIKVAT